jgi:hypothetical protein
MCSTSHLGTRQYTRSTHAMETRLRAAFKLAISGMEIHLVGYAFVDDSDIIQTVVIRDMDIDKVFEQAQQGLNTFVGGMKVTGGQVRPDKCNYYKIEFVWRNDKWKYRPSQAIS